MGMADSEPKPKPDASGRYVIPVLVGCSAVPVVYFAMSVIHYLIDISASPSRDWIAGSFLFTKVFWLPVAFVLGRNYRLLGKLYIGEPDRVRLSAGASLSSGNCRSCCSFMCSLRGGRTWAACRETCCRVPSPGHWSPFSAGRIEIQSTVMNGAAYGSLTYSHLRRFSRSLRRRLALP